MASKLTLISISSGFKGTDIQTNFTSIEDEFDDTLSRTGKSPNQMESAIDMNSFEINNLGVPSNNQAAARLKDVIDQTTEDATSKPATAISVEDQKSHYSNTNVEAVLEEIIEGSLAFTGNHTFSGLDVDPEHATDSGTDAFVSATNTTPPADGAVIIRDFQSANTTTTPTLDGKTMTTRDGSALWAGAVSGVHELQYASGTDTYLVLEPLPIDEDDMASDSAAAVPTQQSAKFYIDNHSPINLVTDFGADDTGVASVTAAFNNAVSSADDDNREIWIPTGDFLFDSKPNDLDVPVTIRGAGIERTTLRRNYNESGGSDVGFLDYEIGSDGSILENLEIIGNSGTSGGCAIAVTPNADTDISWLQFKGMRLTSSNDNWGSHSIIINGTASSTAPLGVRDVTLENMWVFGAPLGAAQFSGAVNLTWSGGGTFSAGGTSGEVNITGTSTVNSSSVSLFMAGIGGNLVLQECERVQVVAGITGDLENLSSAVDCVVLGRVEGTVQTNWTNSTHYGA